MIRVENLQKVSDERTVLEIDYLLVDPGEIAAIIGSRDSGKAVLLSLLTGL